MVFSCGMVVIFDGFLHVYPVDAHKEF